jgi:hypothetical protein
MLCNEKLMAASPKRRKTRKTARPKARTKTIAAGTGPVTLAEAKALARAKHPKLAARAMRKGAVPLASPAGVGAEREKLENERRQELANRISEYKATMVIMKRCGARRDRPKKDTQFRAGEPEPKGGSFTPLQIFAEGRFVVRLSGSILRRRHHPALGGSARYPNLESGQGGR